MADKTIPQVPDDLKEFHKWTENADWSWPMGTVKHMARELIERLALAESQAAELREEVERLKLAYGLNLELHGCGGENCTEQALLKDANGMLHENATLRAQMEQIDAENDELLTEINQLYMQLERQQRAVTDEEWNACFAFTHDPLNGAIPRSELNDFIKRRATRSREQEPEGEQK